MHSLRAKKISAAFIAGGLLWLVLVAGFQPQEIVAGAICTAVTVAFMVFVARQTQRPRRFLLRDVAEAWRVPGSILMDSVRVTRVLLRALIHREICETGYVTAVFVPGGPHPQRDGRKTLAVLYTTAGPNTIALGVSDREGCMMLHTLEPAPTPKVIHELAMGAMHR